MISRAVRLYGKNDLRIDTFALPELKKGEILLAVKSSAICTSCYKVTALGEAHHRVPNSISEIPIILGHEFAAEIADVEDSIAEQFVIGEQCIVQPMMYEKGIETLAVGHSYSTLGGYATYVVVPQKVVQSGAIISWKGDGAYRAALAEPLACIIAAWRSQYHTAQQSFKPIHGTKHGGKTLLLGGSGSMGFMSALLWQLRSDNDSQLVIFGRNESKLNRLRSHFNSDKRITIVSSEENGLEHLQQIAAEDGFDDIVVFVSSKKLIEFGLSLLSFDGCLNMFAGPFDEDFEVSVNFHAIHYKRHHIVGSSGASEEDFKTAIDLLARQDVDPSFLVTHVGGLEAVPETVCTLQGIGGGKKLIYPHCNFPLTELSGFEKLAQSDSRFESVANAIAEAGGFWSTAAETALLQIRD